MVPEENQYNPVCFLPEEKERQVQRLKKNYLETFKITQLVVMSSFES